MTEIVQTRIHDQVCVITLNQAETRNALNMPMAEGLLQALQDVRYAEGVRAVVITGGPQFMAGGDIRYFADNINSPAAKWRGKLNDLIDLAHGCVMAIRTMDKPVVASVDGAAAGFGLSLMMACDFAVVTQRALFTLAYIHIGTSPDGGSTFSLPRHVGAKRAAEIAMLGDRFGAEEALTWGLVNKVVPVDQLEEASWSLASRLANMPTKALGRTKALLRQSLYSSLEEQLHAEAEQFGCSAVENDFREGISAFLEKRKPQFTGQ